MSKVIDAFGEAYMAYLNGEPSNHYVERDDGNISESDSAYYYFRTFDEWKTYERHEGMFYSLITLMGKIANSISVPLSLLVLELTGYQAASIVQPDSALMGIRLLIGPIPAVLLTGGIIFAIFYPLSRKQHGKIVKELHERRKARKLKTDPALGAVRGIPNE